MIRENSTVLFFWGELTVDLNWTDKHFFSSSAQCHRIDVVSGCGKNAEGAVQTLSLVFHNRTQKKNINPCFAKVWLSLRVACLYQTVQMEFVMYKEVIPYFLPLFKHTYNVSPFLREGPFVTWRFCFCAAVSSAVDCENMAVHITVHIIRHRGQLVWQNFHHNYN